MRRLLFLASFIAMITVGGAGCTLDSDTKQDVNELALEYLEQKYGEKFEYSAPAGASYTGTRTFLATCESLGDKMVLVQIENFRDEENRVVKDNYLAIKYEEEVRELFKQMVNEEFGFSHVSYGVSGRVLSSELPSDASLEEYLGCREGMILADISVPESCYQDVEQIKRLFDRISDVFLCDEVSILFIVVDDDTFEVADSDDLRQIFLRESGIAQARFNRFDGESELEIWGED